MPDISRHHQCCEMEAKSRHQHPCPAKSAFGVTLRNICTVCVRHPEYQQQSPDSSKASKSRTVTARARLTWTCNSDGILLTRTRLVHQENILARREAH